MRFKVVETSEEWRAAVGDLLTVQEASELLDLDPGELTKNCFQKAAVAQDGFILEIIDS